MTRFTVIFDRDATADLAEIRDYIAAKRDRVFADAFVARLIVYCESFSSLPHRGTMRDEVYPGLRTVGWRRTVTVAFQVSAVERQVVILAVLYRGRDVLTVLKGRHSST